MNTTMELMIDVGRGLWGLAAKIFVIVVPLLVFLEWARSRPWFDRFIQSTHPLLSRIGFRPQALFPLLTGVFFGIAYGAGVLIPQARSGELDRKQIFLIGAFLCICHAIVEDTLLFVAVGGSAWVILLSRTLTALVAVYFLAKLPWPKATPIPASDRTDNAL